LSLPNLQSFWSWTTKGTETDLYLSQTLVARLFGVEHLNFSQTSTTINLQQVPNYGNIPSTSLLVQSMAGLISSSSVSSDQVSVQIQDQNQVLLTGSPLNT